MIPYLIGIKFATEVSARLGSLHSKLEENCSSHFRDTSGQHLGGFSSGFFSTSFRTLCKIRHKTRMRALLELKFGTRKGLIKADPSINFGRNPMNIHGIMTDYLRNKKVESLSCPQGIPLEGMS